MFVLDAAMGWMFGAAAGGVGLIALLALGAARRRRARAAWRSPLDLRVQASAPEVEAPQDDAAAAAAASEAQAGAAVARVADAAPTVALAPAGAAPVPAQDAPMPAASAAVALPVAAAPAQAAPAMQRTPEQIRAEIAAHAERLAAARAARAQRAGAERSLRDDPAGSAGVDLALDDLQAPAQPVFDPTRSTPWQQVVESVARARAGEARPQGATQALRAAVAAGGTPVPPRPVSVRPSDFMVRTAVPRMPPLDPSELQARPRRVLVADDARVVRVKLQRLLAAQGWQVIEAADGEEALRALGTHAPDLLITDVDMPGLDGFALTRALRAQAATAQLPVVMITAADDQHREEAVRAGVTVLLGKPYGEAALLSHLRRLMGLPAVAVAIEAVPA